jgi:hypothetical protein
MTVGPAEGSARPPARDYDGVMIGVPDRSEAAPYYFTYINLVEGDVLDALRAQSIDTLAELREITEEQSLERYAPGKWSIREVLGHLNDTERLFGARAFWFARGFDSPLPSFDQDAAVATAGAHERSWHSHVEEFRDIRLSTVALFANLPDAAWRRQGIASGNPFSVRALAYLTVGHFLHHMAIVRERYLKRPTP